MLQLLMLVHIAEIKAELKCGGCDFLLACRFRNQIVQVFADVLYSIVLRRLLVFRFMLLLCAFALPRNCHQRSAVLWTSVLGALVVVALVSLLAAVCASLL